jgi:hypothetical protein
VPSSSLFWVSDGVSRFDKFWIKLFSGKGGTHRQPHVRAIVGGNCTSLKSDWRINAMVYYDGFLDVILIILTCHCQLSMPVQWYMN